MPLYEYECESCGSRIEVLQRVGDPPLQTCDCGDEGKLRKLISAPAFQFKGEGWYVTDYARKKDNGKGDKAEAKSDGGGDKGSGGDQGAGKESTSAGTKAERVAAKTPPTSTT